MRSRILVFGIVSQHRLGALANGIPIESSQRFFGLVKEAVDLALDSLAGHE
jgi:hypothetical protein